MFLYYQPSLAIKPSFQRSFFIRKINKLFRSVRKKSYEESETLFVQNSLDVQFMASYTYNNYKGFKISILIKNRTTNQGSFSFAPNQYASVSYSN